MGNFYRDPVIGADDNSWGNYVLQLMADSRGANSCRLYNDAGDLKITAGKIGINDGITAGICDITAETIDMSGVSSGNWAKIEISVSGTAYTIAAADIAGETTELLIPSIVKAAYDDDKQGYYLTATKRLIGIAWKDSGGNLGLIYNTENCIFGFKETKIIQSVDTSLGLSDIYILKLQYDIGDWNMDSNATKQVDFLNSNEYTQIRGITVIIRNDDNTTYRVIPNFSGSKTC